MHSDQTVSLRPGGGKGRLLGPRGTSSSSSTASGFSDPLLSSAPPGLPGSRPSSLTQDGKVVDPKTQKPHSERIQYTRDQLYKFKEVATEIAQEIRSARSEMESELLAAEEQEWARPMTNVQVAPSAMRYSEPDNRDWKSRTLLPSLGSEEKGKEQPKEIGKRTDSDWRDREEERDGLNFVGTQYSSKQEFQAALYPRQPEAQPGGLGVDSRSAAAIIRAASPWTARRGTESEKDKVLRTVKGILNKLTPEKFEVLLDQLLSAGIESADILKGVISLVFDKAVLEPTFCPMYAELCLRLSKQLPEFTSDEEDGKPVTFRRILLNSCQEEFEGADKMRAECREMIKPEQELERIEKEKLVKLRTLGNIRLIGELLKQKMIPEKIVIYCIQRLLGIDSRNPPPEEDVEALCQLLSTVGKQLEESAKSKGALDTYFLQLKELSMSQRLPPRIRFMVRGTIDLRANKWVPRREEVKAKTINEIHAEAEQTLGLRPGMTGLRNGRGAPGVMGMTGLVSNFPISGRPGIMMPGMPGLLPVVAKMPGAHPLMTPGYMPAGIETEGWETFSMGNRKGGREGLIPPPTLVQGRPLSMAVSGSAMSGSRPNSASSKLLPHGSGGSFLGRPSALLTDPSVKTLPPIARQSVGIPESVAPGLYGAALKISAGIPEREKMAGSLNQTPSTVPPAPEILSKKTESLLKEYLAVADLNEAMLCVEELQSADFYPQFVHLTISMGVECQERDRDLIQKLLENLHSKNVLSGRDIGAGFLLMAEQLDDLSVDIPMAPRHTGDFVGKLSLAGVVKLGLLVNVMQKIEYPKLRRAVYDAALNAIKAGPNAERVLSQRSDLLQCEKLVEVAAR